MRSLLSAVSTAEMMREDCTARVDGRWSGGCSCRWDVLRLMSSKDGVEDELAAAVLWRCGPQHSRERASRAPHSSDLSCLTFIAL